MRKWVIGLCIFMAACASVPVPAPVEDLPEQGEYEASGAAVGTAAIPLAKWLGRFLMRAIANTTIDIKVESKTKE